MQRLVGALICLAIATALYLVRFYAIKTGTFLTTGVCTTRREENPRLFELAIAFQLVLVFVAAIEAIAIVLGFWTP